MGAMHIRIVCPEHNAYEAEAAFVSVPASDGELGVLPRHASEIATIVGSPSGTAATISTMLSMKTLLTLSNDAVPVTRICTS